MEISLEKLEKLEKSLMIIFGVLAEVEKREKGCDHCNKLCVNCEHYDEDFEDCNEQEDIEAVVGEKECESYAYMNRENYCKRCGRELVSNQGEMGNDEEQ